MIGSADEAFDGNELPPQRLITTWARAVVGASAGVVLVIVALDWWVRETLQREAAERAAIRGAWHGDEKLTLAQAQERYIGKPKVEIEAVYGKPDWMEDDDRRWCYDRRCIIWGAGNKSFDDQALFEFDANGRVIHIDSR